MSLLSASSLLLSLCVCLMIVLNCEASDIVSYDLNTQAKCTEVTSTRTNNCIWPAGLNSFADQIALGGRIVAYKIQWFNGKWSGWYVPGVNDLDGKFNPSGRSCSALPYRANTMRRKWSYFFDHTHKFIICKPTVPSVLANVPMAIVNPIRRRFPDRIDKIRRPRDRRGRLLPLP